MQSRSAFAPVQGIAPLSQVDAAAAIWQSRGLSNMTAAEKQQRVAEIVEAALERQPADYRSFLDGACGNDAGLRSEVESLLQFREDAQNFIETPAFETNAEALLEESGELRIGERVGAYEILALLGEGGMGEVYLAQDHSLGRRVALKLVKRFGGKDLIRRFRQEERILAALNHPNIARLYGAARTENEVPYFVMEYVEGERLDDYCTARQLPVSDRLRLFQKICAAVAYAHQHLVIHRDIKPANIRVTPEGEPKLLDFGIAKLVDDDAGGAQQTMTLLRVMTPEYASPEQVRGAAISTATDIYSLGVLLYELLTGRKPYRLTTSTPEEIARAVVDQVPDRPSTALTRRAGTAEAVAIDAKSLRGDVDNIVLMALRKEPARRYVTVGQFSEDIRRYLEGRPVLAHKDTLSYRAGKFIRRNKIQVAAAGVVLLTMLGGIIATAWQANHATRQARIAAEERDRARKQARKADRLNDFLQNILGFSDPTWLSANPQRNRDATIADALEQAGQRAARELADEPEVLAAVHFTIGWTYKAQAKFAAAEPHLRASLELRQRVLGREHPETAQSLVGLGEFHHYNGQFAEAETAYREAVEIYRNAQKAGRTVDRMWFAIALNDLGTAHLGLGQLAQAELLMKEGLEISRDFAGNERAPVAVMLSNLGLIRRDRGDLEGAIRSMENGLQEYRKLPGEPRFEMGAALFNLATTVTWLGEYERAEVLAREAFEVVRNGVGEKHPYTPRPLIALSNIHYRRGDYAEAQKEIDRALQLQLSGIPEGHLDFAMSWIVLGKLLARTGQAAEGEPILRRALDLRTRALPAGHHLIADAQGAFGACLALLDRHEEAESLLVSAVDTLRQRFGERDPRTVEAAQELAALYQRSAKTVPEH